MKKTARRAPPSPPLASWQRVDWMEHDWAKNPAPLIDALRSDAPLPRHLYLVLIDLLERYNFRLKPSAKRIPTYTAMSLQTARIIAALRQFRELGLPLERADAHAREWGIHPNTFQNAVRGKHGRRRHYLPKRKPPNATPQ
jgi:hypothetical protein